MNDLFRSVWGEPRPPDPPRRVWRDWALVAVLVPLAVLEGLLRPDRPWRTVSVLIVVALVPTLLWRRTHPLLMITIAFLVSGLASLLSRPTQSYTIAYLLILPYALLRWGSGRGVVLGLVVMLVKAGASAAFGAMTVASAIGGFAVLGTAVALGAAMRYRAGARARELDRAKLLERERLARDLHDTVAHHVSAMAIRAQAGLATMASRPDAAADALRVIEAEALPALAEMRAMVRVLRRYDAADLAPSPRIVDLADLAGHPRTGPAVSVGICDDLEDVAPSVGTAIYRLAQESITNAQRHARHATRIDVRVTADDTSVHLSVSDDGDPGAVRPRSSSGYGLVGMVERAALLGGVSAAGPSPDRGWTVTAALPRSGPGA